MKEGPTLCREHPRVNCPGIAGILSTIDGTFLQECSNEASGKKKGTKFTNNCKTSKDCFKSYLRSSYVCNKWKDKRWTAKQQVRQDACVQDEHNDRWDVNVSCTYFPLVDIWLSWFAMLTNRSTWREDKTTKLVQVKRLLPWQQRQATKTDNSKGMSFTESRITTMNCDKN